MIISFTETRNTPASSKISWVKPFIIRARTNSTKVMQITTADSISKFLKICNRNAPVPGLKKGDHTCTLDRIGTTRSNINTRPCRPRTKMPTQKAQVAKRARDFSSSKLHVRLIALPPPEILLIQNDDSAE
jgi:hypothetical protein